MSVVVLSSSLVVYSLVVPLPPRLRNFGTNPPATFFQPLVTSSVLPSSILLGGGVVLLFDFFSRSSGLMGMSSVEYNDVDDEEDRRIH